jgi:hypothetical protein
MRTNSMTKCAVGAMLFGGTLGLAQTASAAVVDAGGTVTFLNTAPGTGPYAARSYSTLSGSGTNEQVFDSFARGPSLECLRSRVGPPSGKAASPTTA